MLKSGQKRPNLNVDTLKSETEEDWLQSVCEVILSPLPDGTLNFSICGGSDDGKFSYVTGVNQNKVNYIYGVLNEGDILLEIQGQKVAGYTRRDTVAWLNHCCRSGNSITLKVVPNYAVKLHSLHTYYEMHQWLGYKKNPLEWEWVATAEGLPPKMTSREVGPSNLIKIIVCSCKNGCRNVGSFRKEGLECSLVCDTCNGRNIPEMKMYLEDLDDDDMDRLLHDTFSQLAEDTEEVEA